MMPVIVIRPQPGAAASVLAGQRMGLDIHAAPMSEAFPLAWTAPDEASFDGLLIGSANALRHAGDGLARFADVPVYAVGAATAQLARQLGHKVACVGEGGLQGLLDALPKAPLHLLRLSGETRLPLTPPPHVSIVERVVYGMRHLPMSVDLAGRLAAGALVLLHSGEAARHFAAECDRLGLPRGTIALAALAPRILDAAGKGWAGAASAPTPDDGALLALAHKLCQ